MREKPTSFKSSALGRIRPKRHFLSTLSAQKPKRHHSQMDYEVPDNGKTTMIRIVSGLILLHLIVIGGVYIHDSWSQKDNKKLVEQIKDTPPPTEPLDEPIATIQSPSPVIVEEIIAIDPQAEEQVAISNSSPKVGISPESLKAIDNVMPAGSEFLPEATRKPVIPAQPVSGSHITSAATSIGELQAVDPALSDYVIKNGAKPNSPQDRIAATQKLISTPKQPAAPVIIKPIAIAQVAPTATAANTVAPGASHLVRSGDTWYGLSKKYKCSVAKLEAANPKVAKRGVLYTGDKLVIPTGTSKAPSAVAGPTKTPPAATKIHSVKSGETLYRIARDNGISLKQLLQYNKLSEANARRIQIGQKLKVTP